MREHALGEGQRFLLLAILIGLFAGALVACFHITIDFLSWYSVGALAGRFEWARPLVPAAGALVAVWLVHHVFPAARGSGVNQAKAALYVSDGYVPAGSIAGKFAACSISIGSGNSLGPEDPALQMGAGVASLLGRMFRLGRDRMRLIAPVGAAAGIGAAFNTPITGVLFVMEEVVAAWNAAVVGSILLSAVSAVVVARWYLGGEPLFRVPAFELTHPGEMIVYALVGVVGGALSALFVWFVERLRERLERLPRVWARAAGAGLLVGAIGLWLPQVMGAGYEAIDSALHDRYPWNTLLALGLFKMLVTAACFSAGIPGGMFAPTLFTGAMIGGALGGLAHQYGPFPSSPASAYVLVGMGTFFAGVFRAPMTSIFMVFETSASYVIILPAAVANTVAWFVSRQLHPVPFFTVLARQEGVDLPSAEEYRATPAMRVEDAMRPAPARVLEPEVTAAEALDIARGSGLGRCLIRRDGLWWSIGRPALEKAPPGVPLSGLELDLAPALYPDLPVDAALRLLGGHPLLVVASRSRPDELVGTVELEDIHRSYGISESNRN